MVEIRRFIMFTDHRRIVSAIRTSKDKSSPRHLAYVAEFIKNLRHISGKNNAVSDALSRSINLIGKDSTKAIMSRHDQEQVDFESTSEAQKACPEECLLIANPLLVSNCATRTT